MVDDGLCFLRPARAKEIKRRFRHEKAKAKAEDSRERGYGKDISPGIGNTGKAGTPGCKRHDQRPDSPETFQKDEPAPTIPGGQEFRHHRIIHRQRAAHGGPGEKAQDKQNGEIRREYRKHAEQGITGHRDDQHPATAVTVRQPSETRSTQQHAEKERCSGLQRLRHRQPKGCGN